MTEREKAYKKRKAIKASQIERCYREHRPPQIRFHHPIRRKPNKNNMAECMGLGPVLPIYAGRRFDKNGKAYYLVPRVLPAEVEVVEQFLALST